MKLRPGFLSFSVRHFLEFSQISPCEMSVNGLHEIRSTALPSQKLVWTKAVGKSADSVAVFALSTNPAGLVRREGP